MFCTLASKPDQPKGTNTFLSFRSTVRAIVYEAQKPADLVKYCKCYGQRFIIFWSGEP